MGRLIDTDTLKPLLRKQYDHYRYRPDDFAIGVCTGLVNAMEELDAAPAVDAAPVVHGRWIKPKQSLWTMADCSVCGEMSIDADTAKYCPHCGAKMDIRSTNG